jgi:hypothetical protein
MTVFEKPNSKKAKEFRHDVLLYIVAEAKS